MLASIWKPSEPEHLPGCTQRALIYFVCGNPGLIGFYVDFLEALRNLLDATSSSSSSRGQPQTAYDIYGRNLIGFCDDEHEPFGPGNPPADVDAQVEAMYDDVAARTTTDLKPYDFVVLMGHSVGAYICVEMLHRHETLRRRRRRHLHPHPHLRLRHGFLLFPTVESLALSTAGARLSHLRRLPTMEAHMATYAAWVLRLFPRTVLRCVAERVMGFSPRAAGVTAEWLKSRDGVLQALHMAKSELDTILEDRWGDELWEGAEEEEEEEVAASPPRFFIFYGREDHWVANH
ncbi:hypothetical protein E4U41_000091, partial [Claviceps citrina]